jgi:hypothetical protein
MSRRLLPLALLATIAIGGCSYGTKAEVTPEQRQARVQLLRVTGDFDDHELARLCRGLYPDDFLTNEDDYPKESKDHRDPRVTQQELQLVREAGCDVPQPR